MTEPAATPLGALVATDRRPALLERCLASLLDRPSPGLVHVLVVVQEEDEEGARIAAARARRDSRVELAFTRRRSRSAARNEAAALSRGHWIWFIDDDAEVLPGAVEALQEAIAAWPRARALGGPNVGPAHACAFERAADAVLSSALGAGRMARRYRADGEAAPCTERELIACNLAVEKDEFLARRFDERLDYGEETLLLARMRRDGRLLVRDPRIKVAHRRRAGWRAYAAQAWRSGLGRARQTASLPGSLSLECAAPPLLLAVAACVPWSTAARALLALYGAAVAAQALLLAKDGLPAGPTLRAAPLIVLGHAAYGAGLLAGLVGCLRPRGGVRLLADAAASPRTEFLRPLMRLYYAAAPACVRFWAWSAGLPVAELRVYRGYATSEWRPGVSDVDLAGTWRPRGPAEDARGLAAWRRGYRLLRAVFPVLGEVLLADEASWRRYRRGGDFRARGDEAPDGAWERARTRIDRWTEGFTAFSRLSRALLDEPAGWRRSRTAVKLYLDVARHGAVGAPATRAQALAALESDAARELARAESGDEEALAALGAKAALRLDGWARETLASVPAGEPVAPGPSAVARPDAARAAAAAAQRLRAAGAAPELAVLDSAFGAWLVYRPQDAGRRGLWRALRDYKHRDPALAGALLPMTPSSLAAMAWSAQGEDPLKALGWRAAAPAGASGEGPLLSRHEIAVWGERALLPVAPPRAFSALLAEECRSLFQLHWRGRWAGPDAASSYDVWTRVIGRALAVRAWSDEGILLCAFPLEPLALRHARRHPEDAEWVTRRIVERAALGGWDDDAAFLARQAAALA